VEFIDTDFGTSDTVDIVATGSDDFNGLITIYNAETITGTAGGDNIYADHFQGGNIWLDAEGGNDTVVVGSSTPVNTTVYGGAGNDYLTVYASNNALVYGDDNSTVTADGDDYIIVTAQNNATVHGEGGNDYISAYAYNDLSVTGGTGNDDIDAYALNNMTVDGGSGNDSIYAYAWDDATVSGGAGDDSMYVYADNASVNGDGGNDSIYVEAYASASVNGGSGNDTITVESSYNGGGTSIAGGDGNDRITIINGPSTITGGSGDDSIYLTQNYGERDLLMFGNIAYNAFQIKTTDTQGYDTISGFNFESLNPDNLAPAEQDMMNFSAFLGSSVSGLNIIAGQTWALGNTVDANNGAGNSLIVLSATSAPALTSAHFSTGIANTIQLNDNGKAVVVVGIDGTALGTGITTFEIYYVQDIDTGIGGQTWAVDKVATVTAATAIGVGSVIDNIVAGLNTPNGINVGLSGQVVDLDSGNETVKLFGDFADNTGNIIDDFDSGSDNGDVMDLSAFTWLTGMERGGGGSDGGPFSGFINEFFSNGDDAELNINNKFVLVDFGANGGGTRTEIFNLFPGTPGDEPFSLPAGGKALILAGDDDAGDNLYLWFVHDVNGNGSISNDAVEIKLIATLTDTESGIDGFHANDFIFA